MKRKVHKKHRGYSYTYTELGMLLGLFVGGGLAIILVATTDNTVYFAIVGIGLALGLGLGAAFDGSQRSTKTRENRPHREEE